MFIIIGVRDGQVVREQYATPHETAAALSQLKVKGSINGLSFCGKPISEDQLAEMVAEEAMQDRDAASAL